MTSELAFESARSLARKLRRREISSRELLECFLARIERHNPALNAVVTLDVERARSAALAADEALAHGRTLGPLHGLPMTLKDAFEVSGVRTTSGAKLWAEHVSAHDAVAVQRLRAAGAIFVGKTNVPAFCGDVQTFNAVFGTTNNPWDLARTPGGSSGGSAAALAAGLTPIELGSDIGGSIRTPASFCGVFGHKPSYGIVPMRGHMPGPPGALAEVDLNVVGPLARDAGDLALMLGLVAGPPPEAAGAYTLRLPPPRAASLRGYRIACWFDERAFPLASSVQSGLERAVEALRSAGARIEVAKPQFELEALVATYRALLDPLLWSGMPQSVVERLQAHLAGGDTSDPDYLLARNVLRPHREWLAQNEARQELRARCAQFFQEYDAWLCPATSVTAPVHDHTQPFVARPLRVGEQQRSYADLLAWIAPATACYLPATVVPVGVSDGLPVGMQVVGPYLEDYTPIDLAGRIGDVLGGFTRPPGY